MYLHNWPTEIVIHDHNCNNNSIYICCCCFCIGNYVYGTPRASFIPIWYIKSVHLLVIYDYIIILRTGHGLVMIYIQEHKSDKCDFLWPSDDSFNFFTKQNANRESFMKNKNGFVFENSIIASLVSLNSCIPCGNKYWILFWNIDWYFSSK